ncbi:MAG: DUF2029 domain-containing protein [Chloroflexi bacterium]|nr:DUF2029 domain-containing protein [Chloroflexota bacterium]
MNKSVKMVVLILAASLLLAGLALIPAKVGEFGRPDFYPYWASAHLLVNRTNPYDYDAIVALMTRVVPERQGVEQAWNPPWLLVVLMPLAMLPYDVAARMWVGFNLLAISGVSWVAWRWIIEDRQPPVWLPLIGLGFYASLVMIAIGQITIVSLLGLMVCLAALRAKHDGWAGAALVLTLGKPQLVYLALPVILLCAARRRRWRVWVGLIGAWLIALIVATVFAPDWLTGYLTATGGHDFFTKLSATASGVLKAYTGSDALRFVGALTFLLIPWLLRLAEKRDRLTSLNVALLVSVPLAPYGWSFDQIVLLPAIVQLAAWALELDRVRRRLCVGALIAIYVAAFAMKVGGWGDFIFVWVPIALGGLYALVYRARFARPTETRLAARPAADGK